MGKTVNKQAATAFMLFFALPLIAGAEGFTWNLSVSPEAEGASVYGTGRFAWSGDISSALIARWDNSTLSENAVLGFGSALRDTTTSRLQIDALPISWSHSLAGMDMRFSGGLSWVDTSEKVSAILKDTGGILLSPPGQYASYSSDREAWLLSPRLGVAVSSRLFGILKISYDGLISPVYYLDLNQAADYDFLSVPSTNSLQRWSGPYLDQSLSADIFGVVRLVIEHEYQHLGFQTMDWNSNGSALIGVDDNQDITTIRLGVEVLLSNPLGSRLRGGVYWEDDSTTSSHWGTASTASKFIFRLGMDG